MTGASRSRRPTITRRHFIAMSGRVVLAGCAGGQRSALPSSSPGSTTSPTAPTTAPAVPTTVSTIAVDPAVVPDGRVLVLVELAGGNDALNTLVPMAGPSAAVYRSLRPTLGIAEGDLLALDDRVGLHPSLGALTTMTDRLAIVAGVGFADPDRSHFVSFDRWWRADRLEEPTGWLGRWLDTLPAEALAPLGATAVGSGSPVLRA